MKIDQINNYSQDLTGYIAGESLEHLFFWIYTFRASFTIHKDPFLSFEERCYKDKFAIIHHRNLQILATEMYKILNCLLQDIMQDLFQTKIKYYNTCNTHIF